MAVLCLVVHALVGNVLHRRAQLALRGAVGAEPVGDQALRTDTLLAQQSDQQAPRRLRVSAGLQDFVEDIAVLIDRAPQPVGFAIDDDPHLIQMPDIPAPGRLAPQGTGKGRTELQALSTDRLIRNDDPALKQHFLDQPEAQRKPEIQPDRVRDQLARETVSFVAH